MMQPAPEVEPISKEMLGMFLDDFELYGRKCIKIKDHNSAKIVPLILNKGQKILHEVVEKQKSETGYVRALLLKSRRFGGSTYVEGRYYRNTTLNFNRNAFIVGHEKESTNTLFEMAKLMQSSNPIAPVEIRNNEKSLKFDTPDGKGLKSEYRLATAENVDAGRSQGIHYLHGSEEAFWRNGSVLLGGLLQCLPDPPAEHEIIRESTGNGYGNSFQEDVFDAYAEGKYPYYTQNGLAYAWTHPDTDWVLVFIPWFDIERYTRDFRDSSEEERFTAKIEKNVFDSENRRWIKSPEKRLQEKYGLTIEQLNWRRWAIKNKCRGSAELFRQEYPATVEEAFLSQGSNVFGKELCDDVEALCENPIAIGDVVDRMGKSRIRANQYGKLRLWQAPDDKEQYFLTVDSAGGKKKKAEKDKKKDPDSTCVDVWNHRTGVQAAQWHGHIQYDLIADLVILIGRMFFMAPACVELQNHGYTVVAMLKADKYPMYENRPDDPGWLTNAKTKPLMVDRLYQMSRDAGIQIRCKETVSEMRTFVEDNGTYAASSGCKDDRVMSAAMASQMMTLLPKKFKEMRGEEKPFDGFNNWKNRVEKPSGEYAEHYA